MRALYMHMSTGEFIIIYVYMKLNACLCKLHRFYISFNMLILEVCACAINN